MIERLVLARTYLGRNRLIPFLGIGKHRVDVEHHAAERIDAVAHDLADLKFCNPDLLHLLRSTRPIAQTAPLVHSAPPWWDLWRRRDAQGRPKLWPASRSRRPASC